MTGKEAFQDGLRHGMLMGGGVMGLVMIVLATHQTNRAFGFWYLLVAGTILCVIGSPKSGMLRDRP